MAAPSLSLRGEAAPVNAGPAMKENRQVVLHKVGEADRYTIPNSQRASSDMRSGVQTGS